MPHWVAEAAPMLAQSGLSKEVAFVENSTTENVQFGFQVGAGRMGRRHFDEPRDPENMRAVTTQVSGHETFVISDAEEPMPSVFRGDS